jgi:hypothetical protein
MNFDSKAGGNNPANTSTRYLSRKITDESEGNTMSHLEKAVKVTIPSFGALIMLLLSLVLAACDTETHELPPATTGKYPLTGVAPDSGESLDQDIGLDGKWETYCESRKTKFFYEIKGSDIKFHRRTYYDGACTEESSGSDYQYTSTLKPPITTPSGLRAYPIELLNDPGTIIERLYKELVVLHEDTLYWQTSLRSARNELDQPIDIDMSSYFLHELHRSRVKY